MDKDIFGAAREFLDFSADQPFDEALGERAAQIAASQRDTEKATPGYADGAFVFATRRSAPAGP